MPTTEIKLAFGLQGTSEVLKIVRLLHLNKRPIAMMEIFIHPKFIDLIKKKKLGIIQFIIFYQRNME